MLNRIGAVLLAMIFALTISSPILATTVAPTNLAKIIKYTENGFVGTVKSVEVVQTDNGWADKVTAEIGQNVLGTAQGGQTIVWYQARMSEKFPIAGMPKYEIGGEYLIFLAGRGRGTDFQAPYALGQGCFKVTRGADGSVSAKNENGNTNLMRGLDAKKVADTVRARSTKAASEPTTELDSLIATAKVLATETDPETAFASKGDGTITGKVPATP
ncbi:MAG: hypothetical protein ABI579_04885 [Candidatus Sumerlaeota bacterium]